ncbi:hypothetical protein [Metabacillus sp. RGM 3146]|uniref:hypothetical protein n=1 Tax=Metabacillus sp. RGM 3146 TaxID=3401092 RepID=UPI003B9A0C7C
MELLFGVLIFAGFFALFDALRRINNNLIDQTEEIKKFRIELTQYKDETVWEKDI